MTQDYIPFSEIVQEIGSLCKQKATGTLFISTQDNRSAQVMLDQGEIVYVFFSSKRGQEALDLMSTIVEGRYRFQEGGAILRRMQLPPTHLILQSLGQGSGQVAHPAPQNAERVRPGGRGLSPEQKSALESCLADCIGPMATIICEDHLGSAGDLAAAIEALAGEIPSPGQVTKFRELVAERLG